MARGANSRLERMRANPAGDWTIADVQAVCRDHVLTCRPPSNGSHYKISHPAIATILSVPSRRPIKEVYVRKLVRMAEAVPSDAQPD